MPRPLPLTHALLLAAWLALAAPAAAQTQPALAGAASGPAGSAVPDEAAARALHALFAEQFEWSAREFPEFATMRGDLRFNDRLADVSPEAQARRDREQAAFVERALAIPPERLSAQDRLSREMFIEGQRRQLALAAFPAARGMTLRALGGPQTQFVNLVAIAPVATEAQVRQLLARMAALPARMLQEIAQQRRSAEAGWVPARDVLQRVLAQIDAQLLPPEQGPFYQPFTRLGRGIAPERQAALQAQAREAIATQVLPALRSLRALVADELLPRAPAQGGLAGYPGGAAVYALLVRQQTTTDLTPRQIHDTGQRELARLRGEMEAVKREVGFAGDFAAFVKHLHTDPRFFASGPEALLAGYREIAKRVDPELPKLFAELPRAPYGIVAMPAHMGANRAEYYNGPALDGSRAGFFFANTLAWRKRPLWAMETLVAHEAMPGHHLQIARAAELRGLPAFRRSGFGYTAFSEGWALYAETLGFEIGLFQDPYQRWGHLTWQAFRAARLVADTGVHALGWSRQQAIDFMVERTGVEREFVEGEVDRYASQPGQALAYMIGKLKFDELRDRARARLGERFDIRRFHNAVLDQGALPLQLLERVVDEWISAQLAG